MKLEELTLDEWESSLPATVPEVFHRPEALSVIDDYTPGTMRLYGLYNGEALVAAIPMFVREKCICKSICSPPAGLGISRLGPILSPNSPKRRKKEKINHRFIESVLEKFDADSRSTVFRMQCSESYRDPRPFQWQEYTVKPHFTYVLNTEVDDLDTLVSSFSRNLRRDIQAAEETPITVSKGGIKGAKLVFQQIQERYREQDESTNLTWPYVRDLVNALGEHVRVYVVRDPDGEYLTGMIVLFNSDTAYYWQGGVRATYEESLSNGDTRSISANAALHRAILEDILNDPALENVHQLDLVGANTKNLCKYKSKFGGRLVPYYVVESSGPTTAIAKFLYRRCLE